MAGILKWDDSRGVNRFRALCRGAGELNLRFQEENCLWYSQQDRLRLLEGDEDLFRRFQDRFRRDCTAVICFNDEIGFRLQRCLQGLHAPMSVAGFEGSYLSRSAALTTLVPAEERPGAAAVRLILSQMNGQPAQDILLPWRIGSRKRG